MQPIVRHLIVCEDIQRGSGAERYSLVNVITRIRALDPVPFPLEYRELCVLAICTECRGRGQVQLQIVDQETEKPCRQSLEWPVSFANEPLKSIGFPFRIGPIRFPRASMYKVQMLYNGVILAEEPLHVSE